MCDKKCKNIECNNLLKKNRTYCSLKCRNIYVNKYLRDYSKNGAALSKEGDYDKNPKYCKDCNKKILYKKRNNQFCNSSCQAKNTNRTRVLSDEVKKTANQKRREKLTKNFYIKCKNCESDFFKNSRRVFCSDDCKKEFKRKI